MTRIVVVNVIRSIKVSESDIEDAMSIISFVKDPLVNEEHLPASFTSLHKNCYFKDASHPNHPPESMTKGAIEDALVLKGVDLSQVTIEISYHNI